MESNVTAFFEDRIVAAGPREDVTRRIEEGYAPADLAAVQVFDDATGARIDLDYWDVAQNMPARSRGRPRLGVTPREITLLPRHWEWLQRQKGGASAALRRLVEDAMKAPASADTRRDAACRFLTATCGDREGYEEAIRCLYRRDEDGFAKLASRWPADFVRFAQRLLGATPA